MKKLTAKYINFFNNVMMQLGHHDWKIEFISGHDSYCWESDRVITIGIDYNGDIRQIILHEIAHINVAKYCNQKHTPQFWKYLIDLTRKYLHTDLDESQKNHMKYMSNGYYSLKYRRKK